VQGFPSKHTDKAPHQDIVVPPTFSFKKVRPCGRDVKNLDYDELLSGSGYTFANLIYRNHRASARIFLFEARVGVNKFRSKLQQAKENDKLCLKILQI
jgi:hypothetical protein